MSSDKDITQKTETLETSRHLALGAAVDRYYQTLPPGKKLMVDSFLPKEIRDLLQQPEVSV